MPDTSPAEAPAAPAAPAPAAAVSTLASLADSLLGTQGSLRRLLVSLPGVILLALNHKIGLELNVTEQGIIAGVIVAVVTASNLKEASVTKSQAATEAKS